VSRIPRVVSLTFPGLCALLLGACGTDAPPAEVPAPSTMVTASDAAETIYTGGRVYTVDPANSWAEAIAVREGRILAVGSAADLERRHRGSATELIDLGERMVMPGIHDMHAHLAQAGTKERFECGFPFMLTLEQILAKVAECVAAAPAGEWLRGGQWAMELLDTATPPHRSQLDAIAPDTPVLLIDSTVHAAWVNSKALQTLGITRETPDPSGGVIVRDESGEATGILLDNAAYAALQTLPAYSAAQMQEALAWSIAQLNAEGVTAIKDAMVDGVALAGYAALERSGALNAHIATSLAWRMAWAGPQPGLEQVIADRATARGELVHTDFIKIMLDGIPPSQTAAVLEPYVPDGRHPEGHAGYLTQTPESLAEDLVALDAQGLTVKIHATGDRSVRVALDAIEAARTASGQQSLRHEISHAEMISDADLPRFRDMNVTAEMSPILWYPSPLHAAMEAALGKERADRFWPVKTLLETGALLIYGSDWPSVVPSASPWPGIEAMVTRRDPYGVHEGALAPQEAIDLVTTLRIFTRNGAEALYTGDRTGSLEPGKSADFIVLDRNLFEIPPEQISDTRVLRTVFRGRTVHEAP